MSNTHSRAAFLFSLFVAFNASTMAAQPEAATLANTLSRLDGMSLEDLIASTAGDVRADKLAKYGGDFTAYWQAASSSIEGKAFEAIAANTSNGRFRATGEGTRLIPTAFLGQAGDPADLVVVNATGGEVSRVQAKLGVRQVIDALEEARYAEMDLLTTQDSYDALQKALDDEAAKSLRRGVPMKPSMQRLARAMDSGRIWSRLPCGAPLPQRAPVSAVARSHYSARWEAVRDTAVVTQDDTVRGVARVARETVKATPSEAICAASRTLDDATVPAISAGEDVLKAAGRKIVRMAGPIASGVEVAVSVIEIADTESRFANGDMTQEQREVAHIQVAGGVGGSYAGGTCGATVGAAIGTAILPGVGTAVGAIVGGAGGAIAGSSAGRYAAAEGMKTMHAAGVTVDSASRWVGRRTSRAYRWATSW